MAAIAMTKEAIEESKRVIFRNPELINDFIKEGECGELNTIFVSKGCKLEERTFSLIYRQKNKEQVQFVSVLRCPDGKCRIMSPLVENGTSITRDRFNNYIFMMSFSAEDPIGKYVMYDAIVPFGTFDHFSENDDQNKTVIGILEKLKRMKIIAESLIYYELKE